MKDYEFLQPAQIELEEEVKYYNEQQPGLGYDFAKEVADTIARILRYPGSLDKAFQKNSPVQIKEVSLGVVYQTRATRSW